MRCPLEVAVEGHRSEHYCVEMKNGPDQGMIFSSANNRRPRAVFSGEYARCERAYGHAGLHSVSMLLPDPSGGWTERTIEWESRV